MLVTKPTNFCYGTGNAPYGTSIGIRTSNVRCPGTVQIFFLGTIGHTLWPGGVSFPMSSPFFFIYLCLHENF
jgi:hypothetical protein